MDHDIGGVENVIPVRDVLNVDEINNAAVNESVQNIAGAATYDKAKTNILKALNVFAKPQIERQPTQYTNIKERKKPPGPLCQAKYASIVSYVRKVNEGIKLYRTIDCDGGVYPNANSLRQQQC